MPKSNCLPNFLLRTIQVSECKSQPNLIDQSSTVNDFLTAEVLQDQGAEICMPFITPSIQDICSIQSWLRGRG